MMHFVTYLLDIDVGWDQVICSLAEHEPRLLRSLKHCKIEFASEWMNNHFCCLTKQINATGIIAVLSIRIKGLFCLPV